VDAANDRVGIGTASPTLRKLHIYESGQNAGIHLQHAGATAADWLISTDANNPTGGGLIFYDVTAAQYRMVINSSGNVGIGTTGPLAPLDVAGGTSGDRPLLYLGEPGDHTYGFVFRNSNTDGVLKLYSLAASVQSTNPVMSWSRPSGNVGIGTTGPTKLLHVADTGTTDREGILTTREGFSTGLGVDRTGGLWGAGLYVNGTKVLLVDSNAGVGIGGSSYVGGNPPANGLIVEGNVGIGTTGPEMKLHVNVGSAALGLIKASADGTSANLPVVRFQKTGSSNSFDLDYFWNAERLEFQYNDTAALVINNSGNVGIGTTGPTSKLQVAGGDVGLGNATATGNQPVTVWLTNGSGVQRVAGEIVIIGGSDNSFTTTTTANNFQVLGVVYDTTIAIGAVGRVAIGGVVSVLSQGAVTRGNYLVTSTTAGKATHATSLASGQSALGRWLESLGGASTGRALIRY